MVCVVLGVPVGPADVAELVAASASHVVAPLVLLDHEPALLALAVVQVGLEKLELPPVALALVHAQQTLGTELLEALVAHHHAVQRLPYHPFAVFAGAQSQLGVLRSQVELLDLFVVFLDVGGQSLKELGVHVEEGRAAVMGALHLLEVFDLKNRVVVQAALAKTVAVFAVAHKNFQLFVFGLFDFVLANFAILCCRESGFDGTADGVSEFGTFHFGFFFVIPQFAFCHFAFEETLEDERDSQFDGERPAHFQGGVRFCLRLFLCSVVGDYVAFDPSELHSDL